MKRNFILGFIICAIFFSPQLIVASGDPVISLSPSNGATFEGGINGYGREVTISYDVSNLESCWWRGTWTGFEVWLYIDGNEVAYYRDQQRPPFFTYYSLTYSNSLSYYLSQGTHTIQVKAKSFEVKFDLYLDVDESVVTNTIQIIPPPRITTDNNFTDQSGVTHGLVNISGYGTKTVPFTFEKNTGQDVTLTAISPQTDNQNYQMIWHNGTENTSGWFKDFDFASSAQSYSFTVSTSDNNSTYEAQLRKICIITFQNNFTGIGNGGTVTVDGQNYSSPTPQFQVVALNPISASAQSQTINGIDYSFSQWNDGNTSNPRTFYPSEHSTYTANFTGKPNNVYRSLSFNYSQEGQPVQVT